MSNTISTGTSPTFKMTLIPQTGSDVTGFVFNARLRRAQVQASGATSSMFLGALSSGNASVVLPNGQSSMPLELDNDWAGQAVTFNGTNATNVTVIEYLYASS